MTQDQSAQAGAGEPLKTQDVMAAIYAVDREAARRGEMFPQTSDEQRDDRRSITRVMGMLAWYEKNTGCARIKGWPTLAATPAGSREPADQMLREECDDADAILRALGLEPDAHRTDGGRLNVPKIRSALSRPGIDGMVDRFLGWPLPKTFRPDCGISFDGRKDDEWNKNKTWPVGTNLFNAEEARAMFEYVLAGSSAALATPTASCEAPADERAAFEAWFEQWRVSTWWTLRSEPQDKPCPAHWNINAKFDCERGWLARAALASPANVHQAEAATKLPDPQRLASLPKAAGTGESPEQKT